MVAALTGVSLVAGCQPTNEGYAPAQPVNYSHAVHAGSLQIPCMYCHYGAEKSRHAGVPPAEVCLNCHRRVLPEHPEVMKVAQAIENNEPIRWVRVHRLPDHAFFDHSIHVNKGVACQTCHGAIESMGRVAQSAPLTMGWCLACHRQQPAASVVASDPTLLMLPRRATTLTDCSTCHH
jgi:hypothetical protein